MNNNLSNEQLVERYLDNEMSQVERSDFELKLEHDLELKEELTLQQDLIDGIKESRRLELKSRLSDITVNPPYYQTLVFKSIVTASITGGIAIGAYFYLNDEKPELSQVDITIPQSFSEVEESIPEMPQSITPIVEDTKEPVIVQEKPKEVPIVRNTQEEEIVEEAQPSVVQPEIVGAFDEQDFESEEIENESATNSVENINENIGNAVEVTAVKDRKNKFHYKFIKNKLYLLGSFDEMPYEIIELNKQDGKSYYLFYDDSFYNLELGQEKATPLIKIENDSLVNELKIIQSNHQ